MDIEDEEEASLMGKKGNENQCWIQIINNGIRIATCMRDVNIVNNSEN